MKSLTNMAESLTEFGPHFEREADAFLYCALFPRGDDVFPSLDAAENTLAVLDLDRLGGCVDRRANSG